MPAPRLRDAVLRRAARCLAASRAAAARLAAALRTHRTAQRVHQIDDIARLRRRRRRRLAGLLGLDQRLQRILVAVGELRRVEMAALGLEDVLGKFEHVLRHFHVLDVGEIILGVADLVLIAQRRRLDALAERLEHQQALVVVQHDAGEPDQAESPRMASRITAKASTPTSSSGVEVVRRRRGRFRRSPCAARRIRCRWCGCFPAPLRRVPRVRAARRSRRPSCSP